jgi:hypothetical protein
LVDLSKTHPHFWKDQIQQLVIIVSDIVKARHFEDGTRSQAAEVVLTLSESVPATVRKIQEVKNLFFPALIEMIACCEEDESVWNESADDEF